MFMRYRQLSYGLAYDHTIAAAHGLIKLYMFLVGGQ